MLTAKLTSLELAVNLSYWGIKNLVISGWAAVCQQTGLLLYLFQVKRSHPDTYGEL